VGLSIKEQGNQASIYRYDPAILWEFYIDLSDPNFGALFASRSSGGGEQPMLQQPMMEKFHALKLQGLLEALASKRKNCPLRLAVASWVRSSSACRLH
jgi:hypothetical protein